VRAASPGKSSKGPYVDAAAARLEPDVVADFNLMPVGPTHLGAAGVGDAVFKIGRTSGETSGRIESTSATVKVMMGAMEEIVFHDCLVIRGQGTHNFSSPGDAGAMIVRRDGVAVGLLIAGSSASITVSLSLERVFEQLKLRLLPNPNGPVRRHQTDTVARPRKKARPARGKRTRKSG